MPEQISLESLIDRAYQFFLGPHEIPTLKGKPPVILEKEGMGWVIRAEQPGSMNPHYLNQDLTWRYKAGTTFGTKEKALAAFNAWLALQEESDAGE
jgi:hypothetical protein